MVIKEFYVFAFNEVYQCEWKNSGGCMTILVDIFCAGL